MAINGPLPIPVRGVGETPASAPVKAPGATDGKFANVLQDSISEVNKLQQKADASITALATTGEASLHETMIAMEEASVSFKLMMQVRNKIVEAYQEVMRIQV
ncbi:flagellar hook-basal body complex protein FliE [Candidatus Binatia bacterium]|jgi:flagellar hook-basal body complex protein FliE|nr:flagellar hook-basal body complex protein FliE [Candidatus Binatia bacterium]